MMPTAMNPNRILVCGDTHGNAEHLLYLYEQALAEKADVVFILGDYGYWEHHPDGWAWLEANRDLAEQTGVPTVWLDGNHENHPKLWSEYENAPRSEEGFWQIRKGVFYAPRGHRWSWGNEVRFMSLGGATSIDKPQRLKQMRQLRARFPTADHSRFESWWATEDIRPEDMGTALSDRTPIDVLLCHDKPRGTSAGLKDHPDLTPNQDRVTEVIKALKPKIVIHGHLHRRYTDELRISDSQWTQVIGLAHDGADDPRTSWEVLDLVRDRIS